jgi:hypothetical protein
MRHALPLLLLLTLAPATASADLIIPPQPQPCDRKKAGDACDAPQPGICEASRCCTKPNISPSVLHYREKNGIPPSPDDDKETCRDCLKCIATPGADMPPAAPDAAPDLPAPTPDTPPPAPDAAPELPATTTAPTPPSIDDISTKRLEAPTKPKGGMCASAPWYSDAGAWSLLAGALLLVTLTTRRRA